MVMIERKITMDNLWKNRLFICTLESTWIVKMTIQWKPKQGMECIGTVVLWKIEIMEKSDTVIMEWRVDQATTIIGNQAVTYQPLIRRIPNWTKQHPITTIKQIPNPPADHSMLYRPLVNNQGQGSVKNNQYHQDCG